MERGEAFIWYYMVRNRLHTMRSYGRFTHWLSFLVYFPLLCLWKSVWYAWHGNRSVGAAIFRGAVDGLRGRIGETFHDQQQKPTS